MKKTAIHIITDPQGDSDYLILYMDEQGYADFLEGKEDYPVTAFNVLPMEKGEIVSMLIELHDGTPKIVTATEA